MSDANDAGRRCLFVYGTLLDAAERASVIGRPIEATPARIAGWRRGRKRHYFIERAQGETVEGAILEGLDERDLKILDEYEEVPSLYTRERIVAITRDGREIECWVYRPGNWAPHP